MAIPKSDFLLYDGKCPVCDNFVSWSRVEQAGKDIELIDARSSPDLVRSLGKMKIDVNDTMVLQLSGVLYVGSSAFTMVEKIGSPKSRVFTPVVRLASIPLIGPAVYIMLVVARKLLLALLGRKPIICTEDDYNSNDAGEKGSQE